LSEQEARALVDRFWDELLELDPMIGTMVGDERFDDRLPDPMTIDARNSSTGMPDVRRIAPTSWRLRIWALSGSLASANPPK